MVDHISQREDNEQEIHLADYVEVVLRRKWIVLAFLSLTILAAAVFTYTTKPVFKASSKLVIGSDNNISPLSGQAFTVESYYAEEKNFNTHFKLITSKPVLQLVVEELDKTTVAGKGNETHLSPLVQYGLKFKKKIRQLKKKIKDQLLRILPIQAGSQTPETADRRYLRLLSKISVVPVDETRIMEVAVMDTNPAQASLIANLVAQKYIAFDRSTRLKSSSDKLAWMTSELYAVKKKLEDSEKEFIAYKQNQKMFSMEGRQNVINQKIANFNQKYLEARNKKLELDVKLKDLQTALGSNNNIMQIKSMVDEPMIKDLYAMMTTLEIEKGHLAKVYKSKHPKLIEVDSKISNTRVKLKVELEKKLSSMRRERNIWANQEQEMKNQMAKFENEAMQTSEKELTYNILQRNVNTSQQIYDVLLTQIKESNILQSSDSSNLTVVETADIPVNPVKPNKKRNFILSVLLGLFGGIGLCFFLDYFDQTIRDEESAENLLGYPVLTVVPDAEETQASYGGY